MTNGNSVFEHSRDSQSATTEHTESGRLSHGSRRDDYSESTAGETTMAQETDRLRRYLTDALGECRDEDLEQRVTELEDLIGDARPHPANADLDAMAALANETRLAITRVLVTSQEELCVCELNVLFDVSDSAVSQALSELTDAGLVTRRKDGQWRKYRATPRATALLAALDGTRSSL